MKTQIINYLDSIIQQASDLRDAVENDEFAELDDMSTNEIVEDIFNLIKRADDLIDDARSYI